MMNKQQDSGTARRLGFAKGVLFTGTGTLLNIGFLFLETAIAVRLLATESYGSYVFLIALVNFFVMLIDFGCKISVTQLIAGSVQDRRAAIVTNALLFRLAVIAIVSLLIWPARSLVPLIDPSQELLMYVGYIPPMLAVASLDELLLAMLQGFQSYRQMAIAQIIRSVLRLCLTAIMLGFLHLDVRALIYSWTISFGVSVVYQYLLLPVAKRPMYDRRVLHELLRFGLPLQLTRVLWFVFGHVHVLLLGAFAGPVSLAYYGVAARVPDALHRFSDSFISVYFPTMAGLLANGKDRRAVRTLDRSLRLVSLAAAAVAMVAVVFNHEIVTLLFSEKYIESGPAFAILMIALHMMVLINLMGYTLTAAGRPSRSLGENLIRTATATLANLLLIPIFGFMGSVYATLASSYAANPVAVWLLRRSGIAVSVQGYLLQTAILLACSGLFWWTQTGNLLYRVGILALFIVLNLGLSARLRDDLRQLLEKSLGQQRMRVARPTHAKE